MLPPDTLVMTCTRPPRRELTRGCWSAVHRLSDREKQITSEGLPAPLPSILHSERSAGLPDMTGPCAGSPIRQDDAESSIPSTHPYIRIKNTDPPRSIS